MGIVFVYSSKSFSETLERDLRTLLLKLSVSDSLLSDNPPGMYVSMAQERAIEENVFIG